MSDLYVCKEYETPYEEGYRVVRTIEEHNKIVERATIEKIKKWCTEQSRILKKESEVFNNEECFGGYRAFEEMIRYLNRKGAEE